MLHYLYLDYGGLPKYRRELKYSLISLKAGLDADAARIVIYTDDPAAYAAWPVTTVDIQDRIGEWSGGGLYYHRLKPATVLDALGRFAQPACLLDCDSIIRSGFHAEVAAKMASAVVMNRFEKSDPFPPLAGFRTLLPHLGPYHYDRQKSWMFNSGLIGVKPEHAPVLEDALAFIDALIGRAKKFPAIEQFALSEVLRRHGIAIAEVADSFVHYWQGRRRIYMAHEIEKTLSPDWNDLTPPQEWAKMDYWKIRAYNYYYGVSHALSVFRK